MSKAYQTRYREAGVDPDLAGSLIRGLMKNDGQRAETPLPSDYFCQLVPLPDGLGTDHAWLAIGTDGIGTKLMLGRQTGLLGGLGQDLVGMVYNDLITCGGTPFAFLDYYATGGIEPETYSAIIQSVRAACEACDMPLLGGETAEMPGLYAAGDFDLAGFGVAGVRTEDLLLPARTLPGDVLIGFPSSGFHSNGYSLIRKVIADQELDLTETQTFNGVTRSLGEWFMEPTRLYVDVIAAIRAHDIEVVSLAHITGGGYFENLPRSLASHCAAELDDAAFQLPHCALFDWFSRLTQMTRNEMLATFNSGYGLVAVCRPSAADAIQELFPDTARLGRLIERQSEKLVICNAN